MNMKILDIWKFIYLHCGEEILAAKNTTETSSCK